MRTIKSLFDSLPDEEDFQDEDTAIDEDVCCYCGDPDTDKVPVDPGFGPERRFSTARCHAFCEEGED